MVFLLIFLLNHKHKGEKNYLNNYRGISVLPPIAKVFEKALSRQISNYFESNNLFFNGLISEINNNSISRVKLLYMDL